MKQSGLHITTSEAAGDPSAFRMQITIENQEADTKDITQLVDSFRVIESVYQQALIAEMTVADGVNFLEDFHITGNEKVQCVLIKKLNGVEQPAEITTSWYVMDMPLFARPKPDAQVYTIRLVSPFGLISKMRRVEHVHKGTAVEILQTLYRECGVDYKDIIGQLIEVQDYRGDGNNIHLLTNDKESTPPFTYIPPKPTYSDAIQQILSKTAGPNGAPYFAYETFIGGQHILNSYNKMIEAPAMDRYYHASFSMAEALTDQAFEEKRRRILEISSNLGFSPYKGFRDGAYTTRTHTIDWQTKSYVLKDFNSFRDSLPMLDKDLVMHPNFSVSGIDYTNTADTHALYYSLNSQAFADRAEVGIHEHMPFIGAQRRAILANLGQIEHLVKLHGDPSLTPGRTIEIEIPKSGAADTEKEREPDLLLSGRYLIISATHTFDNNGYTTQIKLARDGIDRGGLAARPVQGQPDPTYGNPSTGAPLSEPLNVSGIKQGGPDDGLRGEPAPKETVVVGYEVGEVDPALAAAAAAADQIAGDTDVRTAENAGDELSAFGGAGAAVGNTFTEEDLEDELKKTSDERSSEDGTGPQ